MKMLKCLLMLIIHPFMNQRGAVGSQGTEFRRWNDTLGAWEKQAEITGIAGPTMTRTTIDTTALDTTGGYMTFIGGLRDGGAAPGRGQPAGPALHGGAAPRPGQGGAELPFPRIFLHLFK